MFISPGKTLGLILPILPLISVSAKTQTTASLTIDTANVVSSVSPNLYGLMTEEINYSYDGGLYAEMIRNRTFTTTWPRFEHWRLIADGGAKANWDASNEGPSTSLPHSLQLRSLQLRPELLQASATTDIGVWPFGPRQPTPAPFTHPRKVWVRQQSDSLKMPLAKRLQKPRFRRRILAGIATASPWLPVHR